MAALTPSSTITHQMPADGQYKMATYRVTSAGQSVTNEWIATGGEEVRDIVGYAVDGATGATATCNFVLNASGTSATAGANPGNLGVECSISTGTFSVTVIYR